MAVIDHLVYAVPDLDASIDWFELTTGVRPAIGGSHPNRGTRNALASFGESYLEIIGPDPRQPEPESGRPFGVVLDMEPRLVTFAVRPGRGETIESLAAAAAYSGSDPGDIVSMNRTPPGGDTLRWRLTLPPLTHDGVIPFLIDWGDTTHPADTAPSGLRLERLEGATADIATVRSVLTALDIDVPITSGAGGLTATIATPQGTLVLS
jgi:catechol 2,3-dioxygenase-like lactoylglutathione lyase family enzyme